MSQNFRARSTVLLVDRAPGGRSMVLPATVRVCPVWPTPPAIASAQQSARRLDTSLPMPGYRHPSRGTRRSETTADSQARSRAARANFAQMGDAAHRRSPLLNVSVQRHLPSVSRIHEVAFLFGPIDQVDAADAACRLRWTRPGDRSQDRGPSGTIGDGQRPA